MLRKVYVVDDEKFDRLLYKREIDKSGVVEELELFSKAEDALAALRSGADRPDLIFLDINMPGMTGFDFLEQIDDDLADAQPPTVVAVLTTSSDPRDETRARSFRSTRHFLHKPLRSATLIEMAGSR